MKKIILSFLLFSISVFTLNSQDKTGNLFFRNHNFIDKNINPKNTAITQGVNGIIYVANQKGLLSYDGADWRTINTPSTPYALYSDSLNGYVYVGCKNEFGYIKIKDNGIEEYVSLSKNIEKKIVGNFSTVFQVNDEIYFYSSKSIYRYNITSSEITGNWEAKEKFKGVIINNNKVYVNTKNDGIHFLEDKGMTLFNNTDNFVSENINFSIAISKDRSIVCFDDNSLYYFNGKEFESFSTDSKNYLKENNIVYGIKVNDDLIAIGTLTGGVVLINSKDGSTHSIINYQTGLPDDEIFSIGVDNQNGIWISHVYGISRVDYKIPIKNYSNYYGLQGTIFSVINNKNNIYVSTSKGVFLLSKLSRKEINKYSRQKPKINLANLFKRNRNRSKNDISYYNLFSIKYGYKPVSGIDYKCKILLQDNNKVIAGTNNGLYSISGLNSTVIIPDIYVNTIIKSNFHKDRFYIGTDKGLIVIEKDPSYNWKTIASYTNENYPVLSLHEKNKELVLAGSYSKILMFKSNFETPKILTINSNFDEEVELAKVEGEVLCFSHSNIYKFTDKESVTKLSEEHAAKLRGKKLKSFDSHLWIYNGFSWNALPPNKNGQKKQVPLLNVISNLNYIFTDDNGDYWCLDRNNNIFKIIESEKISDNEKEVSLRLATDYNENHLNLDNIKVDYDNSNVKITLNNTIFYNESKNEFQYKLEGLNKNWSSWKKGAVIEFPFLPEGSYKLKIKMKDVFGNVTEIKDNPIKIRVVPPYYRRWWFYILEILIISVLLISSIFLNANEESTALSKTLTFLTFLIIYKLFFILVKNTIGSSFFFDLLLSIFVSIYGKKVEARIIDYSKTEHARKYKEKFEKFYQAKIKPVIPKKLQTLLHKLNT